MKWLSGLARNFGSRRHDVARRHPGVWKGRTLEPGCEIVFLNFNAVMGVSSDGRIQREPELADLLAKRPTLRAVLLTDAQRSEADYRQLLVQLPESIAERVVGVATTAAQPQARFESACRRFAADFQASAYIALDSLARGYTMRCPFLVITGSSGLDRLAIEKASMLLAMQQRVLEEGSTLTVRERLRTRLRETRRDMRRVLAAAAAMEG